MNKEKGTRTYKGSVRAAAIARKANKDTETSLALTLKQSPLGWSDAIAACRAGANGRRLVINVDCGDEAIGKVFDSLTTIGKEVGTVHTRKVPNLDKEGKDVLEDGEPTFNTETLTLDPLFTTAAWVFHNIKASKAFGKVVEGAGFSAFIRDHFEQVSQPPKPLYLAHSASLSASLELAGLSEGDYLEITLPNDTTVQAMVVRAKK